MSLVSKHLNNESTHDHMLNKFEEGYDDEMGGTGKNPPETDNKAKQ